MSNGDEAEQNARAESLMQEIDRLTSQQPPAEKKETGTKDEERTAGKDKTKPTPESPREFIHRRMRELDEHKDDQDKK
jgi:hypothetical protein